MGGINLAAFTAPFQYARPVQQETPWDAAAKFGQLRALAQMAQLRQAEVQNQQLEAQKTQMAIDRTKAINQAYMSAFTPDETGVPQLDETKLTQALTTGGWGSAVQDVMKGVTEYRKGQAELSEKQADLAAKQVDHGGEIGAVVKAGNYDPHLLMTLTQDSMNRGTVSKANGMNVINALQQAFQQDPTGQLASQIAQQKADQLIANSPKQQGLLKTRGEITAQATTEATQQAALTEKQRALGREEMLSLPVDPNTKLPTQEAWDTWSRKFKDVYNAPPIPDEGFMNSVNRSAVAPDKLAEFDLKNARNAAMAKMTAADWSNKIDQIIPPTGDTKNLNARTKLQVQGYAAERNWDKAQEIIDKAAQQLSQTESAVRTEKAKEPIKIYEAGAEASARAQGTAAATGLTEDDKRRAGEQYALTGEMPPMGRDAVTRGQIMHYAQEYARQNNLSPRDMAVAGAAFKGDVNSLKALQKNRDAVVAFEETATKNLDQFLTLAKDIHDTGVPWLNLPIRVLDEKLVGRTNIAAVNAARQVANNEIAKVTSNPGLSGALTDTARREVMDYNPKSATFAQTRAVAAVLRQDMANRHQAYDAMINTIKGRMAGGTGGAGAGATDVKTWNPQTQRFE